MIRDFILLRAWRPPSSLPPHTLSCSLSGIFSKLWLSSIWSISPSETACSCGVVPGGERWRQVSPAWPHSPATPATCKQEDNWLELSLPSLYGFTPGLSVRFIKFSGLGWAWLLQDGTEKIINIGYLIGRILDVHELNLRGGDSEEKCILSALSGVLTKINELRRRAGRSAKLYRNSVSIAVCQRKWRRRREFSVDWY